MPKTSLFLNKWKQLLTARCSFCLVDRWVGSHSEFQLPLLPFQKLKRHTHSYVTEIQLKWREHCCSVFLIFFYLLLVEVWYERRAIYVAKNVAFNKLVGQMFVAFWEVPEELTWKFKKGCSQLSEEAVQLSCLVATGTNLVQNCRQWMGLQLLGIDECSREGVSLAGTCVIMLWVRREGVPAHVDLGCHQMYIVDLQKPVSISEARDPYLFGCLPPLCGITPCTITFHIQRCLWIPQESSSAEGWETDWGWCQVCSLYSYNR